MAQAMGIPVPLVYTAGVRDRRGHGGGERRALRPARRRHPDMGFDFTLRAFIVVVVGGMGNLGGSILASIFISLLEAYAVAGREPRPGGDRLVRRP